MRLEGHRRIVKEVGTTAPPPEIFGVEIAPRVETSTTTRTFGERKHPRFFFHDRPKSFWMRLRAGFLRALYSSRNSADRQTRGESPGTRRSRNWTGVGDRAVENRRQNRFDAAKENVGAVEPASSDPKHQSAGDGL